MKDRKFLPAIITGIVGIGLGLWIHSMLYNESKEEHIHEGQETMEHQIWTCSMHPQIRQNEPGECPICGMDLIPLDESTSTSPIRLEMSEEAVKLSNIATTIIGKGDVSNSEIVLSGRIEANETTSASLVTHIPGRIEKLYVSFTGEKVNKGQRIALIYSPLLITAQKELIEAAKIKDEQPKLYEASVNKLKYWKIADKQIEEIISTGEIKENFVIYAENSGIVQQRKVSVGDHLKEGGVLFNVQDLNRLWVVFDAYEKDLPYIKLGDEITYTTQSLPGREFKSKVTFIDPIINPQSRTAKVRLDVSNTGNLLKPDMFVAGQLASDFVSEMDLTVPKSAVLWTGTRSVVYIKVPELSIPTFEFKEVLLGESIGDEYQVIDGLNAGDEVVTNGAFVIDASAQLNNQASMMNRLVEGVYQYEHLPDYSDETPVQFKKQLENTVEAYLLLKDDLVRTDASAAMSSAKKVLAQLEKVDMVLIKGEAHTHWMHLQKRIKTMATHISGESDVKVQRDYFVDLSAALTEAIKVYGLDSKVYYEDFCPMANDKIGAFWLSKDAEIQNPYFGDKMLGCGEVKNKIDADFEIKHPSSSSNQKMAGHNH